MPNCSINGCKTSSLNAKERKLKLYSFPKDVFMREKWISACRKSYKFNDNNARICSKHFAEDVFETPMIQKMLNYSPVNSRKLKPDAIPTLYLPPFAESEVKIDTFCNEIDNIPIDELEDEMNQETQTQKPTNTEDPQPHQSDADKVDQTIIKQENEAPKKTSQACRVTYQTLLSTYQKLFTENEKLRIENKSLKTDCEKNRKLYEKHLLQNIKLRQRNRALVNDNHKLRSRLKKLETNYKMEYEVADVIECCVYEDDDPKPSDEKLKKTP